MEIAMVAIRPLLTKLGDLLFGEFTLENRVRKRIKSLLTELELMHDALHKVAEVPHEQLNQGVKIWAGNVKELSYHMEDIIDAFMVRVDDGDEHANPKNKVKKLLRKTIRVLKKGKHLHRISDALVEVVEHNKQLADQRQRYEQDMCPTEAGSNVDPRLMALYTDVTELVGIEETRDELIKMLTVGDDLSKHPLKTVSIVGFGGLGKTTLAKTAYDKVKVQYDCGAFVSVSQHPDTKIVFKNILYELDKDKYADIHNATRDEKHLIDELIEFLTNKRYLIIIDDIWDDKVWKLIKCAFSKKSPGSRLITTTRIVSVSRACCSSGEDIYRMKPLSQDVSRRLFNKRVFSHEKRCPPELLQVSEEILQKCGGIPLAIISIASLLSSNSQIKTKNQWYALLSSIGHGLTDDYSLEGMKKILLLSYYDLPSHLKPCLLYLSIFPEDHKIMRGKLIWKWISEGFICSKKQEPSLYELGDSYFNELVNRSMIQPIGIDNEERVEACRVHDMVLDLIRSLSSEGNFVTILDGNKRKMANSQSNLHRISVQNSKVDVVPTRMAHVRSLTVFPNDNVEQVLNVSIFQVLRVLDLEGCTISDIRHVGSLLHLRYLALADDSIQELPMGIGKIPFLQTMDLRNTYIKKLPSSVVGLRHLACLHVARNMILPSGIGNLTSLQVLVGLVVRQLPSGNYNLHVVKELGHLKNLRVLRFLWKDLDETLCKLFVESLNNLHKLESLDIYADGGHVDLMRKGWVPPQQLRRLYFELPTCPFLTLPTWINPSSLPLLSCLCIRVDEVRPEDIQLLGLMPALRSLQICADSYLSRKDVVQSPILTADAFPCMTECRFVRITAVPSIFPRGAAPKLRRLRFDLPARWFARGSFDFLGMRHLPSLEHVRVLLWYKEASDSEVDTAEAAVRAAAEDHPNRPTLRISRWGGGREPRLRLH